MVMDYVVVNVERQGDGGSTASGHRVQESLVV